MYNCAVANASGGCYWPASTAEAGAAAALFASVQRHQRGNKSEREGEMAAAVATDAADLRLPMLLLLLLLFLLLQLLRFLLQLWLLLFMR